MKVTRIIRKSPIALVMLSGMLASPLVMAELDAGATLKLAAQGGETGFERPVNGAGSWFAMESGKWVYTGVDGNDGVKLGETQEASTADDPMVKSIDNPWIFFSNNGLHQTTKAPTILSDDGAGNVVLDFSGWGIDWNKIPTIPMSGGSHPGADGDLNLPDGQARLICTSTCEDGDSFILDYSATVPEDSGTSFSRVKYHAHLEGTISAPVAVDPPGSDDEITDPDQPRVIDENAPVAGTAHGALLINSRTTIDLGDSVTDPQGNDTIDFSTLKFSDDCVGGEVIFASAEGVATYADGGGVEESCSVTYTVKDTEGLESADGIITIRVREDNIAPIANDDSVVASANESIEIAVLANDIDGDDAINAATVVADGGNQGTLEVNPASGVVTYTPNEGASGSDTFTYTFTDPKNEISNPGTVFIRINQAPTAVADTAIVGRNSAIDINVLENDDDDGGVNAGTVIATDGVNGTTEVDSESGVVTYTPADGFSGTDNFEYSVSDIDGLSSNVATVTVQVINVVPQAADISATLNSALDSTVIIDPLGSVSDADGSLDAKTVAIATQPENGAATVNAETGAITYTPNEGYLGQDSFTYTVNDNDGGTSNAATINVTIADASAAILDEAAILSITPGAGGTSKPEAGTGSWFAMEAAGPGGWIYVGLAGNQGLQLGTAQPASSAPVTPSIDNPWTFFGNTGLSQSISEVTIISDDGAGNVLLNFAGWAVTWNSIPVIPLDLRPHGGIEAGAVKNAESVAVMTCAVDCSDGDTYTIVYTATVPDGDASGFGNVSYELHLEGKVSLEVPRLGGGDVNAVADVETIAVSDSAVLGDEGGEEVTVSPGDTAQSLGSTSGTGITATSLGLSDPLINPESGQQCIGGCSDFVASGVAEGEKLQVVFRMVDAVIPEGSVYRQYKNGGWVTFDATTGDEIGSAAAAENGLCTDASGEFDIGLKPGNQCVYLSIRDGGSNDADGLVNGEVKSLGGVALPGASNRPAGSSSGCSVSGDPVKLYERADWLLMFGLLVWLGFVLRLQNRPEARIQRSEFREKTDS